MTRFEEPMIKVVSFATPDVITTSLDDVDVQSKGGYNDMKDTFTFEGGNDPFAI